MSSEFSAIFGNIQMLFLLILPRNWQKTFEIRVYGNCLGESQVRIQWIAEDEIKPKSLNGKKLFIYQLGLFFAILPPSSTPSHDHPEAFAPRCRTTVTSRRSESRWTWCSARGSGSETADSWASTPGRRHLDSTWPRRSTAPVGSSGSCRNAIAVCRRPAVSCKCPD